MYHRIVVDFIDRNRMIYNPARGLPRDCKYPMKSDAELKKYMKSAASATDVTGDSDIDKEPKPNKEIPKAAAPLPRKPPVKCRKERAVKRKRVPSKPPTVEVEILSEESDISSESDDDPAPPKRGRLAKVKFTAPAVNDLAPVMTSPALLVQTVNPPAPPVPPVSSDAIHFTPSVSLAAPALPLPPASMMLPLVSNTCGNLPCSNDQQQFVNAPFGNCYAMLSGLLYDNIVQKTKLDELQKREEKRQHEEAKVAFQNQMMSMLSDFK